MTDLLEGIFGSKAKARLIRFFMLNDEQWYTASDVALRNRLRKDQVKREMELLATMKFLQEKKKRGGNLYMLNKDFLFYPEIFNLISSASRFPQCQSLKKIRSIGDVRLVMVSGVFLNYDKGKADILLVANHVSNAKLNRLIGDIEAELGKEVRYVLLDTDEFKYRLEMVDRFLMDFFDSPHEEVVNKITNLKRMLSILKR